MAIVDWAVICDLAYFDRDDRVCMFGVETTRELRQFPLGSNRLAIVVHLRQKDPDDDVDLTVSVMDPRGG